MGICLPFVMYAIQMKGRTTMAEIKKYTKKDGSTAYMFNAYLGVNPKTGKPKRTTRRGFSTSKEAKLALARLELGEDEPTPKNEIQKKYTTFKDVYETWYTIYKETVSPYTAECTARYFKNHILPALGNKVIDQITYNDCQLAVIKWAKTQKRFSTYKDYASKVMKYARKNKWINYNPFDDVDMPKKWEENKKETDKFYTKEELNTFLNWAQSNLSYQDFTAFRVLAYSGVRKGELRALLWDDVDFKANTIDINKAIRMKEGKEYVGQTKNDPSMRIIGLDDVTIKILKKWNLEQRKYFLKRGISINKKQYIFSWEDNQTFMPYYRLSNVFKKYPGKKISIHGFRHTHATLSLDAGVKPKDVQARLGHIKSDMTMNVYAHPVENNKEITQKFVDYLNN